MYKKILFTSLLASLAIAAEAQVSFGDVPATMKAGLRFDVPAKVLYPQILKSKQIAQDEERSETEHLPFRIGKQISVYYDLKHDGEWHTLPNGDQVWLLRIQSEDALSLILNYSDFFIPKGAELFIYNQDRTQILGSYTQDTHPQGGAFSTEMVAGGDLTLELVIPRGKESLKKKVRLAINGVGYCYNGVEVLTTDSPRLKYGESSSCMINIHNTEGNGWEEEAKGVTQMTMLLDDGWYVCSGTMINTTAQDLRPYLLSACHCYSYKATATDMLSWQFKYFYEAPGAEDEVPTGAKTLVGCKLLAASPLDGGSDGLLLELTEEVPLEWGVYFNGWDRRDSIMTGGGVGIHHPKGDIKKISTFDTYKTDSWYNADGRGMDSAHWEFQFVKTEHGHAVTEGGSSGSPLFKSRNHLVFGTLTGGDSSCSKPDGLNYYGKLAYHWDAYGDSTDTQMKTWLDPMGLGVDTLQGIYYNPDAPRIDLSTKEMMELSGDVDNPGEPGSFTVNGYNLTDSVKVLAPEQFQISLDGETWADSLYLGTECGDVLVRYNPNITGDHYGNIEVTSPEVRLKRYLRVHASCCRQVVVTRQLPNGDIQQPYEAQIELNSEDGPFKVALKKGTLPKGVTIDENGLVSGTPEEDGIFDAVINVTDRFDCVTTATVTLYVKSLVVKEYPFTESFEKENFGGYWKQTFEKGEVTWQMGKGINEDYDVVMTPKSGDSNALFFDKSYDANTTLLVSPQLDFTGAENATLHFWYLLPSWDGEIDELSVLCRKGIREDWEVLKTYKEDTPFWTEQTISLPDLTDEYFIAFRAIGHYGYGMAIDDVQFTINDAEALPFVLQNNKDAEMEVYSAAGEHVATLKGTAALQQLPKGAYVVKVDDKAVKFIR